MLIPIARPLSPSPPKDNEMLCSISKPSSSSWLNRLRSSKGFPAAGDHDLEHFLSSSDANPNPNPNPNPNAPPPETSDPPLPNPSGDQPSAPPDPEKRPGDEQERLSDLITNVLAELFIMGDPPAPPTLGDRKSSRKQPNPKLCIPSASASADGSFSATCRAPAMSPASADNSVVAGSKKIRTKPRRKRGTVGPVDSDLSAYSRTEVTVIDTSLPTWKAEKLIFRKGAVWKVRDKKLWHVCRKKRKLGLVERLIGEKDREPPIALDEGCTHSDKIDASKETDDQIQIPIRRPKFSRSPRVAAVKDPLFFHLQVVGTSRKNGAPCPRDNLKGN